MLQVVVLDAEFVGMLCINVDYHYTFLELLWCCKCLLLLSIELLLTCDAMQGAGNVVEYGCHELMLNP